MDRLSHKDINFMDGFSFGESRTICQTFPLYGRRYLVLWVKLMPILLVAMSMLAFCLHLGSLFSTGLSLAHSLV